MCPTVMFIAPTVTREEFEEQVVVFFSLSLSGRCVIATLLPDIHPSCWIMSGFKRTCVDLWSGLTSSSHLCKWAWLGHCMTMWPCCRFITFFLFFSTMTFFFLLTNVIFLKKKKKNMTRTVRSVHCHAYQIVCSALTFFVSQVKAVKYIQWMIFNSLSTPCSAV